MKKINIMIALILLVSFPPGMSVAGDKTSTPSGTGFRECLAAMKEAKKLRVLENLHWNDEGEPVIVVGSSF